MLIIILFAVAFFSLPVSGQENAIVQQASFLYPYSMDEVVAMAISNNPVARNLALAELKDAAVRQQAVDLSAVQVKYWQRSTGATAGNDRLWSVSQDFGSIPTHFRQSQRIRSIVALQQAERALSLDEFAWQVKSAYADLMYYRRRLQTMQAHAHYFEALISVAELELFPDSVSDLIKISAGARYATYQSRMFIAEEAAKRAEISLRQLMYIPDEKIELLTTELNLYQIHPEKHFNERFEAVKHKELSALQIEEAASLVKLEKSKLFPSIHVGYIHQNIEGINSNYQGWMVGISVPLWLQPQRARIKQAGIDERIKANEAEYSQFANHQHIEILKSMLNEYFIQISFSRENLLPEAELMLKEIETDFSAKRISDYAAAFTKISYAVDAKLNHLEYISLYNQTAFELEYFTQ